MLSGENLVELGHRPTFNRFTKPAPLKEIGAPIRGLCAGRTGLDSRVSPVVFELLSRIRASQVAKLLSSIISTERFSQLNPFRASMGSRKSVLELWRKREMDLMRILPRLRWWGCRTFHSHQSKPHQFLENLGSGSIKHSSVNGNKTTKDILGNNEILLLHRWQYARDCLIGSRSPSQVMKNFGPNSMSPCLVRSMSSQASMKSGKSPNENKKDISKVEDPFDAPTYNIPEKPVTFAEGTSYFFVILAGLGIASAAAYSVFKELIFEQKEYTIFNKSLKRIQDDAGVRVRIGHPITGYGQESRNRAARQRIPYRNWTDENGVEHVEVNFYIRGPHGAGKVFSEMYKDQADKQWKFTYLLVEIRSPSTAQLILESYLPAYSPELAAGK